jgi:hypothetical protein
MQKKLLGMQTLFEGTAVGIMDMLRTDSCNPLFSEMIRRVEQDEARHAAFGVLQMRRVVREATSDEMNEMEDWSFFILEALNANQNRDMLKLFEEKYGFEVDTISQMLTSMPEFGEINSKPFMHTVIPNLKKLGLITERTETRWRDVGLMVDGRAGAASSLPIADH